MFLIEIINTQFHVFICMCKCLRACVRALLSVITALDTYSPTGECLSTLVGAWVCACVLR